MEDIVERLRKWAEWRVEWSHPADVSPPTITEDLAEAADEIERLQTKTRELEEQRSILRGLVDERGKEVERLREEHTREYCELAAAIWVCPVDEVNAEEHPHEDNVEEAVRQAMELVRLAKEE